MPMVQLPLDLLDPLDWMVHLAFRVPQDPLEQQVSLDSEERRETVGSWALREEDKRAHRAILESEAHLARLG